MLCIAYIEIVLSKREMQLSNLQKMPLLLAQQILLAMNNKTPFDSALEAIRVRFRPVMMTAFGTIAGMIPIALEQAVGLERLSPLADVAIGGLLIGTLLTLIYVPMLAYVTDPRNKKTNPIEKLEE
jgi:multidrug efflux pump subunit AcrB